MYRVDLHCVARVFACLDLRPTDRRTGTDRDVSWQKMVCLALGLGLLFLLSLYWYQEKLLYQPKIFPQFTIPSQNPPGYRSPADHDMPYEDVYLTTSDGLRLHAWFVKQPETAKAPTLLFFHANAGSTYYFSALI